MIKRSNRFHGHNSLRRVYQNGYSERNPLLTLKYVPNTGRKSYRLAVVVSKKVSKSAVMRNRIRRRLYEIIRTHDKQISTACDLVFTVYSDELALMPGNDLEALALRQLSQARLLQKPTPGTDQDHGIVVGKEK